MKKAGEYARRLRRTLPRLKAPRMSRPPTAECLGDQVVRSLLLEFSNETAAATAFKRLREATVDMNELRVTPIAELVESLGAAYPKPREASEAIARTLASIFNRCHHMDLDFLKQMRKREARKWLETLDGMSPFSAAVTVLRGLGHHAVPIDDHVLRWLRGEKLVDPDANLAEVQAFLERTISPARVEPYFHAMRNAAAAWIIKHPPPPPPPPEPVKPEPPRPDPRAAIKPGGKSPARPDAKSAPVATGKSAALAAGGKPPAPAPGKTTVAAAAGSRGGAASHKTPAARPGPVAAPVKSPVAKPASRAAAAHRTAPAASRPTRKPTRPTSRKAARPSRPARRTATGKRSSPRPRARKPARARRARHR